MRVLITGSGGSLGSALVESQPKGAQVIALPRARLDVSDSESVGAAFERYRPKVVFNAAAYNEVDQAEDHPERAAAVNRRGPENLADHCKQSGALLVHVSTDYVFDGLKGEPYLESDPPRPINVYGRSKLEGEEAVFHSRCEHLVVRTSWLYGHGPRPGFADKVLEWAREHERLELTTEHVGSPTYAPALAEALWGLVDAGARGLLHWAGEGQTSRFEFGLELLELAADAGFTFRAREVDAVPAARFPLRAPRPPDTALASDRIGSEFPELMPAQWKKQARRFIDRMKREQLSGIPVP